VKSRCLLFFTAFILVVAQSCTIQKRHYRKGFYTGWNASHAQPVQSASPHDTISAGHSMVPATDTSAAALPQITINEAATPSHERQNRVIPTDEDAGEYTPQPEGRAPQRADDLQPEGKDRINVNVSALVGAAIVCSLAFLILKVSSIPGSAVFFFFVLPLLAITLFALAMWLRRKFGLRAAAGGKSDAVRLSAHFHRFRVVLYLFFIGSAIMALGWALFLSTGLSISALGSVGAVLAGGGMALVQGVAIVLAVLFLIWLFHWRNDPTGYKKPREKHPRKDG
jgi:hypothetical protein